MFVTTFVVTVYLYCLLQHTGWYSDCICSRERCPSQYFSFFKSIVAVTMTLTSCQMHHPSQGRPAVKSTRINSLLHAKKAIHLSPASTNTCQMDWLTCQQKCVDTRTVDTTIVARAIGKTPLWPGCMLFVVSTIKKSTASKGRMQSLYELNSAMSLYFAITFTSVNTWN